MQHKSTKTSIGLTMREAQEIGQVLSRTCGGIVIYPVKEGVPMTPTFVPETQCGQINSTISDRLAHRFKAMGCKQMVTVGKEGKSIVIDLT